MTFPPIDSLEPRRFCAVDLFVASADFPIGTMGPKEFAQVSVSVRNNGTNGAITPFSGRIYLSHDTTLDSADLAVGSFTIGSLPANTTAAVLAEIALRGRVPKGTYYGLVEIDSGRQVGESNETNNLTAGFMASMTVLGADSTVKTVPGTDGDDVFRISQRDNAITLQRNAATSILHSGDVASFHIEMGGGNDLLIVDPSVVTPFWIHGGAGHDRITGGSGHDTLRGAAGNDRVGGGIGNDQVYGDIGHDALFGDLGADWLFGSNGNDWLEGGHANDRLTGGAGNDTMLGGNNDDTFHALDLEMDTLTGGLGSDTAEEDPEDVLESIEA